MGAMSLANVTVLGVPFDRSAAKDKLDAVSAKLRIGYAYNVVALMGILLPVACSLSL
jgi:hypothetical protein